MQNKRKPRKDVDLTKAVLLKDYEIKDDSCFGNGFDIFDLECADCGLKEICMVLVGKQVKPKKDKVYLDQLDWENVPWETYANYIKNEGDIDLNEFLERVSELSKCLDKVTVRSKVNKFIRDNGFKLDEGFITVDE